MPKLSLLPKWATPERKAKLVELWGLYGNRCLLGHQACPNPEHYIRLMPEAVTIGKPIHIPCADRQGNPIKNSEGNQLYLTLYKPTVTTIYKAEDCRLYDLKSELVIEGWKAEDREARRLEYRLESIRLHSLSEPREPLRGRFSAISKDIWKSNQPLYYIEGLGISGLTLQPFVRVRLSSTYMRLYVTLGEALRGVSKSKKRKAIRYGKPLPKTIEQTINQLVKASVLDYLAH